MQRTLLGRSDIAVAPLALGGNVFGWTADEAASFRVLDAFVDAGGNLIDTADVYSRWVPGNTGGESETIIGRWLGTRGKRDAVVIATKVGGDDLGLGKRRIREAVEASLRRLQTDVIDLYQAHYDDADTPLDETLEAFAELVQAGTVRALGASNISAERFAASLAISAQRGWPRYETLQPHYNLLDRDGYEGERQALCLREGIGVIPYFALASGFLTGKYRGEADLAQSARGAHVRAYLDERGLRVLAALDAVAARYGATPAQIALAWLVAQPGIVAPIASATVPEQLPDLLAGVQIVLDAKSRHELETAAHVPGPAAAAT